MNTIIKVEKLFEKSGGVLTTRELRDAGISYYYIRRLIDSRRVERIKQGVYRWMIKEVDEWLEVQRMVPNGIFCLYSAASLHELSNFIPSEYHLAIPRKDKVILPEFPPIKIYYWNTDQYETGQMITERQKAMICSYDSEKTVCDFIKFRNKTGLDITKEVIKNYLERRDRNLNRLAIYADRLNISTVLKQYLEILV